MGREIFRRIEKDIKERIKRAKKIIFFLDYDGTLVPIKKKPAFAGLGKDTRALLSKLAGSTCFSVFIISGRSLRDIKKLIGVKRLYYVGNHGIELEGPRLKYINRSAKALRIFIQRAYRALKKKLKIKGVILENKAYTLSLHYRLVNPDKVPALKKLFKNTIKGLLRQRKIKVTEGKKVLEVRPNTKWNKGKIVNWILKKAKTRNVLPIYIGDDKTDEDAFKALGKRGISILVSKNRRKTFAQYRLNSPKEVIRFLYEFVD
ncbi:MAG: trehalose-phosphatase [Candidatus Omnitrophota bacterium]|nr:MAG: trehalose-phosphatase [Candidatus Omnitrophota bacterium]